jgi:hypothetical protein
MLGLNCTSKFFIQILQYNTHWSFYSVSYYNNRSFVILYSKLVLYISNLSQYQYTDDNVELYCGMEHVLLF